MKKKAKKTFVVSTLEDRIEFLRKAIRSATERDGSPCMCLLCEALLFDAMAANGEINLKTGERKP